MVFTNALLQGGLFSGARKAGNSKPPDEEPVAEAASGELVTTTGATGRTDLDVLSTGVELYRGLNLLVYSISYGAVLSFGSFGISFTQKASSALMKGLYSHEVGNLTFYFNW